MHTTTLQPAGRAPLEAWFAMWRALCLDLPLDWLGTVDGTARRMAERDASGLAPASKRLSARPRPVNAAQAVALALGCDPIWEFEG